MDKKTLAVCTILAGIAGADITNRILNRFERKKHEAMIQARFEREIKAAAEAATVVKNRIETVGPYESLVDLENDYNFQAIVAFNKD